MEAFVSCEHVSYTIREKESLRVGRAIDCDIRLFRDQQVSRQHCMLLADEQTVRVTDIGSKHGTFVNGTRIQRSTELTDGDVIQVGSTLLVFHHIGPGWADETVSVSPPGSVV